MITYGCIQVATAPGTEGGWIVEAARVCGLGMRDARRVSAQFDSTGGHFRVSCVRHPLIWLHQLWGGSIRDWDIGELATLSRDCEFSAFVQSYLQRAGGKVGELLLSYKADSYIRVEDLPHAFVELLESVGVGISAAVKLPRRPVATVPRVLVNGRVYAMVMDAEQQLVESFDYW